MAERVVELWGGQSFGGGVAQKLFMFRDFATSYDVDVRLNQFNTGEVPLFYGGLPADLSGRQITDLGGREWTVMVPYSARAGTIINPGAGAASTRAPEHGGENGANEPVLFNIGYHVRAETQHITQSIRTVRSAATGSDEPRNFGRAIGVNMTGGKREVQGTDVLSGSVSWYINVQIPADKFTGAYATAIENLLCSPMYRRVCKNDAPFFGYKAGECIIVDADISPVQGTFRTGKFEFAVKRSRLNVTVSEDPELELQADIDGDGVVTSYIGGWSHIGVTYKDVAQAVGSVTRPSVVPFEVYEDEVYEDGDFSVLKLDEYRVDP